MRLLGYLTLNAVNCNSVLRITCPCFVVLLVCVFCLRVCFVIPFFAPFLCFFYLILCDCS